MCISIHLTNRRKSSFFSVPYLEYHFMTANIVVLNLAVLIISVKYQKPTSSGVQAFIPEFN